MSSSEPTISDIQRSVRHAVRLHWHLFLAQGVIMTILGVLRRYLAADIDGRG